MRRLSTSSTWTILGSAVMGLLFVPSLTTTQTSAQLGSGATPTLIGAAPAPSTPVVGTPTSAGAARTATPAVAQNVGAAATMTIPTITGLDGIEELFRSIGQLPVPSAPLAPPPPAAVAAATATVVATTVSSQASQPPLAPSAFGAAPPTAVVVASPANGSPANGMTQPPAGPVAAEQRVAESEPTSAILTIDAPDSGTSIGNGDHVLIGGWAIDPRSRGTGIVAVNVFLDGGPGMGTFVGGADYGLSRADVASFYQHPDWMASGFNFQWTPRDVAPGEHMLHIVALTDNGSLITEQVTVTVGAGATRAS